MKRLLHIVNPTSSPELDILLEETAAPFTKSGLPGVRSACIPAAPRAVQSQEDADRSAALIPGTIRQIEAGGGDISAYIIACFSDPGLHGAREATRKPVYGIAECGLLTAMTLGHTIGVISILDNSIPRHWRMYGAMGIESRIGADIPVGIGVHELETDPTAFGRLAAVGRRLRDERGCEAIVLGCAGMARHRSRIADEIGVPVVDPVSAAVAFAMGQFLQSEARL